MFIKAVLNAFVSLFFRVETVGFENIKNGGVMVCCNHQSLFDVVFLIAKFPFTVNFMAKQELFKNKLFGAILYKMGAFPVNREIGDVTAIKKAVDLLNKGNVLGIFPEGKRQPVGKPQKCKAGAALIALGTGSRILPVAINYTGKKRLFGRVIISVGEIIPARKSECVKPQKTELKEVTEAIYKGILKQWEIVN